jgi:hypothetical protein
MFPDGEYRHTQKFWLPQTAKAQPTSRLPRQTICVKCPVALLKPGAEKLYWLDSLYQRSTEDDAVEKFPECAFVRRVAADSPPDWDEFPDPNAARRQSSMGAGNPYFAKREAEQTLRAASSQCSPQALDCKGGCLLIQVALRAVAVWFISARTCGGRISARTRAAECAIDDFLLYVVRTFRTICGSV